MGIVGLMTGAGAGQGLKEVLAQRLQEQILRQRQLEAEQGNALDERRLSADIARNTTQDQWQKQMFERTSTRQDATDQRVNDATMRDTITESYAPGDTIEDPTQVAAAQRLMPGLVKLRGQQSGPVVGPVEGGPAQGTLAAKPITAPVGNTLADYQGTATQRRAVGTDQRLAESANLSEDRFRQSQMNSDRMYQLALERLGNADDRGWTVQTITKPDGSMQTVRVNPRTKEVEDFDLGGALATTDMRNRVEARKKVRDAIVPLRDLSMNVISKIGPAQRATAMKRGVEAVLGRDPQFRVYQDARKALAGNLAVAQQGSRPSDADIMSIWVPMVPDVFADTSESATMKWDMIDKMSGVSSLPPKPGGGGAETAPAATGIEWVRDPKTGKLVKKGQ